MTAQEFLGLSLAVGLPWLAGALWVRAILAGRSACNFPLVIGYGFPLGMLLVMAVMLLWEVLGLDQGFLRSCATLAVLAVIPLLLSRKQFPPTFNAPPRRRRGERYLRIIWLALLALIMVRLGTLFFEVIWRPLFPWDAWYYYAPRARVWFESGRLVEFVTQSEWLAATGVAFNAGSGRHPDGIPLMQYWTLQGLGRFDDSLMNLPWFAAAVSACMAVYGLARAAGAGLLVSLAAAYALISLPVFGTQVALAGYGDLWISVFVLLAAGSLYLGIRDGDWRHLVLLVPAVFGMSMIKESGMLWLGPLLAGVLFGVLRLRWAASIFIAAGLGVLLLLYHFVGEFEISQLGTFAIGPEGIRLPGYEPVWTALAAHLFTMANWHLLWYVVPLMLLSALIGSRREFATRALLVMTASGLAALMGVFLFTNASEWVIDGTSVNRLLLQLVPALILLGAVTLGRHTRDAA